MVDTGAELDRQAVEAQLGQSLLDERPVVDLHAGEKRHDVVSAELFRFEPGVGGLEAKVAFAAKIPGDKRIRPVVDLAGEMGRVGQLLPVAPLEVGSLVPDRVAADVFARVTLVLDKTAAKLAAGAEPTGAGVVVVADRPEEQAAFGKKSQIGAESERIGDGGGAGDAELRAEIVVVAGADIEVGEGGVARGLRESGEREELYLADTESGAFQPGHVVARIRSFFVAHGPRPQHRAERIGFAVGEGGSFDGRSCGVTPGRVARGEQLPFPESETADFPGAVVHAITDLVRDETLGPAGQDHVAPRRGDEGAIVQTDLVGAEDHVALGEARVPAEERLLLGDQRLLGRELGQDRLRGVELGQGEEERGDERGEAEGHSPASKARDPAQASLRPESVGKSWPCARSRVSR